jgi:hypothetical protein
MTLNGVVWYQTLRLLVSYPRDHTANDLSKKKISNATYSLCYPLVYITIIILDIIHRPAFYLKHNVSKTGFSLSLQVKPTRFDPIDGAIF